MEEIPDQKAAVAHVNAGLLRRLAAAVYDSLLVIAIFVIPTSLVMAIRSGDAVPPGSLLLQTLLCATAALFFIGFWRNGGQTLGMRAWQLRLVTTTGTVVSVRQGLIRFLVAIPSIGLFGLGILWSLIDPDRQTLPDRIAGTRMIVVPKSGQ